MNSNVRLPDTGGNGSTVGLMTGGHTLYLHGYERMFVPVEFDLRGRLVRDLSAEGFLGRVLMQSDVAVLASFGRCQDRETLFLEFRHSNAASHRLDVRHAELHFNVHSPDGWQTVLGRKDESGSLWVFAPDPQRVATFSNGLSRLQFDYVTRK